MEEVPYHNSLTIHPLQGKLKGLYSVSIDIQYRISIAFYIENNLIVPVNIGTNDEVYNS